MPELNYIDRVEVNFDGETRILPGLPDGWEWYKTVVTDDEVDEINKYNDRYTPLLKVGDPILKVRRIIPKQGESEK